MAPIGSLWYTGRMSVRPVPALPVRLIRAVARAAALLGATLLVAAVVTTVWSVLGRWLAAAPLLGDTELVERLVGAGIFLVLPYGHLVGGNIMVDLLVRRVPGRLRRALAAAAELLFAAVAALLAWRMTLGGLDLHRYGETSMMLGLPTWWGFAAGVPALVLLALVCLVRAVAPEQGRS